MCLHVGKLYLSFTLALLWSGNNDELDVRYDAARGLRMFELFMGM